ncbi:MAG: hypothetical protein JNM56_32005 [Planctomycetia bacterium]|nr:hypothetical protein [Planctomycetia bacterium]
MNARPPERTLGQALRAFHEDEDGMEALQVVIIVAIAAVVLGLLKIFWPEIKSWTRAAVKNLTSWKEP